MYPAIFDKVIVGVGHGIRTMRFKPQRFRRVEIVVSQLQFLIVLGVLENHGERVEFEQIEGPTRLEEVSNHLSPPRHIGQPGKSASACIYNVELAGKHIWQLIDFRTYELRGDAKLLAQ